MTWLLFTSKNTILMPVFLADALALCRCGWKIFQLFAQTSLDSLHYLASSMKPISIQFDTTTFKTLLDTSYISKTISEELIRLSSDLFVKHLAPLSQLFGTKSEKYNCAFKTYGEEFIQQALQLQCITNPALLDQGVASSLKKKLEGYFIEELFLKKALCPNLHTRIPIICQQFLSYLLACLEDLKHAINLVSLIPELIPQVLILISGWKLLLPWCCLCSALCWLKHCHQHPLLLSG